MSINYKIVSIEGNIGSGKSTLLENLKKYYNTNPNVIFLREPVDDWEKIKDKEGNTQEQTEWHNISMFGKLAEIGNQYLKKGSQVYLEGRLQTNKSEKDGQTRYFTQIVADQMTMLGSKDGGANNSNDSGMNQTAPASSSEPTPAPAASSFDEFEDDIPF